MTPRRKTGRLLAALFLLGHVVCILLAGGVVQGAKIGAAGPIERPKETTGGRARCKWVRAGLDGLLPRLGKRISLRFVYKQWGSAGATNMRARQMARILATHPDVDVELQRVRDCRVYCSRSRERRVTHVVYVKYPCPNCARHRGAFQTLDVVDNIGFLRNARGSLPPGYTRPGKYSALIVNTLAMAAEAARKGHKAVVIDHQHNNFCSASTTVRREANSTHPFKVLFLGGSAGQLGWLFSELEPNLVSEFPHLALQPLQISGARLMEGFQQLAEGDVAVVWDQCKRSRFAQADCLSQKPNTRATAAMSAGVPVLMYGRYAGHQELAADLNLTDSQAAIALPTSPSALAKSIRELLLDWPLRQAMSQRGRNLGRKKYDIRMIARQYLELFVGTRMQVNPINFANLFRRRKAKTPLRAGG